MRALLAVAVVVFCAAIGLGAFPAAAQTSKLNHLPPARAPCSVLDPRPCHPSFCGIFHRGPCFPQYPAALGQTLQLTIVSTNADDANGTHTGKSGQGGNTDSDEAQASSGSRTLDSIGEMFAALRGCWVPPPRDKARHGMEYTIRFAFKRDGEVLAPPRMTYATHDAPADTRNAYRDAIEGALKRCTPLHFSSGMAGKVAGRPIAIRFVDDRTIDQNKGG